MIYADASRISGDVFIIGYISANNSKRSCKCIKAKDNNIAEKAAIEFALQNSDGDIVASDSLNNVTSINNPQVVFVPRSSNLADLYIKSCK